MNLNQMFYPSMVSSRLFSDHMASDRIVVQSGDRPYPIDYNSGESGTITDKILNIRKNLNQLSNEINRLTREARYQGTLFPRWQNLLNEVSELRHLIISDGPITDCVHQAFAAIKRDIQALFKQDDYRELLPKKDSGEVYFNWSPEAWVFDLPSPYNRQLRILNRRIFNHI